MILDLLAPWVNTFDARQVPAQLGTLALLAAVLLGLALTPLARPSLRRQPATAVLPLVIGAAAFGVALCLWAILFIAGHADPAPDAPVADFGLYLFLFGGGVLMYCGYQLLLEAARASMPAPQMTPEELGALVTAIMANMSADGQPAKAAPARFVTATQQPNYDESPTVSPRSPTPPTPILVAAATDQGSEAITGPQHNSIALPGSEAWSVTPEPPNFVRPSPMSGWQRGYPRR
jgi:hypothetical protein